MPVPDALTQRIGPWPLWGWLGVAGVGIGGGLLLRRTALFGGGKAPELTPAQAAGAGGYLAGPQLPSSGVRPLANNAAPVAPAGGPTDNQGWAQDAITYLIARRISPTLADTAIRKYLEGRPLDAAETAAIDMALKGPPGVPPEGVPPIEPLPAPEPIPSPVPTVPPPGPLVLTAQVGAQGQHVTWTWDAPAGLGYFTVYPVRLVPEPATAMGLRAQTASTWTWWGTYPGAVLSVTVVAYDGRQREISRGESTVTVP